jgi:hypothetical protein
VEPLNVARKELRGAERALDSLPSAQSYAALEDTWTSFLRHLERSYNKAQAQLKRSSKFQGWPVRGRVEALRSKDPLLSYLRSARGAEEHGIEPIATAKPGGVGIGPAEGNSLYIRNMTVDRGKITIDSPNKIRVKVIPAEFVLAPVINRGVKYEVPKSHLGADLPSSDPVTLGEHGLKFYQDFLEEAEREFVG